MSGSFRKALSDLITDLHNSNKHLIQITLIGEKIIEERFYLLGFVPANIISPKNEWFIILNNEQISELNIFLKMQ